MAQSPDSACVGFSLGDPLLVVGYFYELAQSIDLPASHLDWLGYLCPILDSLGSSPQGRRHFEPSTITPGRLSTFSQGASIGSWETALVDGSMASPETSVNSTLQTSSPHPAFHGWCQSPDFCYSV